MKKGWAVLRVLYAVAAAAAMALAAQSCDTVDGFKEGEEAVTWREKSQLVFSAAAETTDFSFTAREAWTVRSDDESVVTITSGTSGPKGRCRIFLSVSENNTGAARKADIRITVEGYEPEILVTVNQSDTVEGDYAVNVQKIDPILAEYYLWNDEYVTLTRDFAQPYDEFLSTTLLSMTTNGEDGSIDQNGRHTKLYSYITRTPSSRTRSVISKTAVPTYGVLNVILVQFYDKNGKPTNEYAFCVMGVYPNTPAERAGIRRGTWILKSDGKALTAENVNSLYSEMVYSPTSGKSLKLTIMDEYSAEAERRDVTIAPSTMSLNPVLFSKVIERGASKIGYLVYSDFEASFDDELLAEIHKFQSAGIDELVLDLRVNGGGHVISSQMLSSIIAGSAGDGKICMKERYNQERMDAMGYSFPDNMYSYEFGPDAAHKGELISKYSRSDYLSLSRVYLLVSGLTASASELVFTALRGIDFPVTLIGERTEGKNVGMEPQDFSYEGYDYSFYPITFRTYNAKNEYCDPDGTVPDIEADEWTDGNSSFWPWGSENDPLLSLAIADITGERPERTRAAERADGMQARRERLFRSPRGGMIAPHRTTNAE